MINAIGIDLAKSVFQLYGVDSHEKQVLSKRVSRDKLMEFMANLAPCRVFMEACGSAHYWGHKFTAAGHEVHLIAGQHVKAFVVGNKDDYKDAKAIVTCGLRPNQRFVSLKTARQLEIQALHRVRVRLVKERTALGNEIRGLLYEHGKIIPQGMQRLRTQLSGIIEGVTGSLRMTLEDLAEELRAKDKRVKQYSTLIRNEHLADEVVKQLQTIPGVGLLTASAVTAAIGNPLDYKNGRALAASLGLVPRHDGTGGRIQNYSISKRGNSYIRTLLVQGAQSALRFTSTKKDKLSLWCEEIKKRRGLNKAAVALANKNARIIWRIMTSKEDFNSDLAA